MVSLRSMARGLAAFLLASAARGQHHDAAAGASHAAVSSEGGVAHVYNPAAPTDPFDTIGEKVSQWMKNPRENGITQKEDEWQSRFCNCLENGYIQSWYTMGSALYIVDTCEKEKGLTLRTGHMQDRYQEPLQAEMSCDMLKLMTLCFSHNAPDVLPAWKDYCDAAHYTVPACDVTCSGAAAQGGSLLVAIAAMIAALRAF
eukprot:TRINITY_DN25003_c0_g1_i1.p2 TRINITY_DN25003_c0_g1~~TRINITY_DN25003_c0_g1_i1.p2  ORF type:complete len:201 (-),score=53.54 TRINITY_DN25003_c0_g1_i1:368-970(-)